MRARATLAAVLTFGLVLTVAALAALVSQRASLRAEVAGAAGARAASVAAALEDSVSPQVLARAGESEVVQITDERGRVRAASPNLIGAPALTAASWPALLALRPGDPARFAASHAPISSGELRGGSVVIGRSLDSASASVAALGRTLAVGVPVLTALAGLITWVLVGGALRPVERMRRQVEEISAANLDTRVPAPGGRDEVARLATTMNSMLARIERGQASQRRFVADASHELKSPLAVLRQSAEVARDYPRTTTKRELAEVALAETERMQRLVEGLLILARSDELALRAGREAADAREIIKEAIARSPGLPIGTTGLQPSPVRADAAMLGRAIANLLSNAQRHARGRICVTCATEGPQVVIRVDDDGAGIGPADRARVFERFTRLDEARARDEGGTGLGLAIVSEITTAHGGSVQALPSPLGGARFEMRLPSAARGS